MTTNKDEWIVSVEHLAKCRLWPGSAEETSARFGGLRYKQVVDKISRLERCDDLTDNEKAYLEALYRTAKEV